MDTAAPICSSINPPIRSAPIRPAQSTRGTGRGTGRAACLMGRSRSRLVRLSLRLRRVWDSDGDCVYRMGVLIACPPSYDCRAIPRRSMRVVMRSGLDQARSFPRLLRIPCGFVSFRPFPALSPRAASSRAHPIPSRFVPSYPPNPLDCFAPIILIAITPRLPYRVSGADFLNASNSMPLKSVLCSGSSLLLACRHAGFLPPRRFISSSHRDAPRSPCLSPSPSHHGVGLRTEPPPKSLPANHHAHRVGERGGRMCLDVIGCHAVDTVNM